MPLNTPIKCKCCGLEIYHNNQKYCTRCSEEIYVLTLDLIKVARKKAVVMVANRHYEEVTP